jgi:hypothetical protein
MRTALMAIFSVKARDRYETHLLGFPPSHKSKDAYESFLLSTAASIVTHSAKGGAFPPARENTHLKPAFELDLLSPEYQYSIYEGTHWWWGPETGSYFRSKLTRLKAFVQRLAPALFGGFALVVPMLIMKLRATTLAVCLTTTLFVIAAAVLLTLYTKSDVLSLTAAYAAVLVVFVGTSTTQGGLDNKTVAIIMGGVCGGLVLVVGLVGGYLWWEYNIWKELARTVSDVNI